MMEDLIDYNNWFIYGLVVFSTGKYNFEGNGCIYLMRKTVPLYLINVRQILFDFFSAMNLHYSNIICFGYV